MKNLLPLHPQNVLWCNGSTTVFGSVSGGSNPPGTTEKDDLFGPSFLFVISLTIYFTASASSAPTLNLATFFAGILIFCPFLAGLTPTRAGRSVTLNVPKPMS